MIARESIDDFGVLILVGGEATRLPGKLTLETGDATERLPMIARVYDNMTCGRKREVVLSGKATFARDLDARLAAPLVIDRWARRGPLGGMLSSFAQMRARFVFVAAGDAPLLAIAFAERLARAYEPGDEALVPSAHESEHAPPSLEPLAALYDRRAFIAAGMPILRGGRGALHLVIAAMRTRLVAIDDAHALTNVNSPADYAAFRASVQNP